MVDHRDRIVRHRWVGFHRRVGLAEIDLRSNSRSDIVDDHQIGSGSDEAGPHGAEGSVDRIGEESHHAGGEDDAVARSHRTARRTSKHPYLVRQLSEVEIWTAHRGVNPGGLFVREGLEAKSVMVVRGTRNTA